METRSMANDPKKELLHQQRERALQLGREDPPGAQHELQQLFEKADKLMYGDKADTKKAACL